MTKISPDPREHSPSGRIESADLACASLMHFFEKRQLGMHARTMLAADYAYRASSLRPDQKRLLDGRIVNSFLPVQYRSPSSEEVRIIGSKNVDLAILTIIPNEHRAVSDVFALDGRPLITSHGRRFSEGTVASRHAGRELSLVESSAVDAMAISTVGAVRDLLQHYSPMAIFLVGIAAGIRDEVSLGDVVIARGVYNYDPGRLVPSEEQPRHDRLDTPKEVYYNFHYYEPASTGFAARAQELFDGLEPARRPKRTKKNNPKVVSRNVVIASGSQLIRDGRFLQDLRSRHDERLIAADQESYAFADACGGLWWGVIRGISDYGDPDKSDNWQYVAAANAALCLRDFIESQYVPPDAREL